jgi:transcriptional regulator with XRE-family HTH domain
MARSTYTKIETGNTSLDFKILVNISKILDVPVVDIIKKNDDPVFETTSEELLMMLIHTHHEMSEKFYKMIPYHELRPIHKQLLKEKGFQTKESYENTPLCGRVYEFGPNELNRVLFENFGMDVLFKRKLISDKYWASIWENYLKKKEQRKKNTSQNGSYAYLETSEIEIDDTDYFIAYIIELKMPGNESQWFQFALKDFAQCFDEFEVLEYIKTKKRALNGDILCFTIDGYDPVTEIITSKNCY